MGSAYIKGQMKYLFNDRSINLPSPFRNFPKKFRVIETGGQGYCGYYALNIGLGLCGKNTNKDAKQIMRNFKNFTNRYGNKNFTVFEFRMSVGKNENTEWKISNNNKKLMESQMKGQINKGLGYFNRYRTGVKKKLNWVEEPFWIWACNEYNVEINIFSYVKNRKVNNGWKSYRPAFANEEICKVYVFEENHVHYSAMEPVNNNNNSNNNNSGRSSRTRNNKDLALAIALSLENEFRQQQLGEKGSGSPKGGTNIGMGRVENHKKREKNIKTRLENLKKEKENLEKREKNIKTRLEKLKKEKENLEQENKTIKQLLKNLKGKSVSTVSIANINALKKNIITRAQKRREAIREIMADMSNTKTIREKIQKIREEKNHNRQLLKSAGISNKEINRILEGK